MLHLITKYRDSNEPHLFLPGIFNSQGCEHTFRHFRSMSTANWTKINFSLYELLHMIGRVELKSEIENSKLSGLVNFPRLKKTEKHKIFDLPSNKEIETVMENAYEAALLDARRVEMTVNANIKKCEIVRGNIHYADQPERNVESDSEEKDFMIDCRYFQEYTDEASKRYSDINENSPFVHIIDEDGSTKVIKKSAIVWLLSEEKGKLSSDRLKRVQARRENESNGPKRLYVPPTISNDRVMGDGIFISNEIKVGQWCLFHKNGAEKMFKNIIVGNILSFKYLSGTHVVRVPAFTRSQYITSNVARPGSHPAYYMYCVSYAKC